MQTGRETLSSIEAALSELQREEQRTQSELEEANRERARLLEVRLGAYRELARVRTRHAIADGVIDQADRLADSVSMILQARQKTIGALRTRHDEAQAKRDKLLAEQHSLADAIAKLEARLDDLARQARDKLNADAAYRAVRDERDAAQVTYDEAEKKTRRAEEDRDAKGKTYKDDPLFIYLWQRNYRREGYNPNRLVRWLDDQVAALIGYHDARANFAVLNEIPVRLRSHVERMGEGLRAHQAKMNEIEAEKIKQIAGEDLIAELAAARLKQSSGNKKLETLNAELSETDGQLNIYAEAKDQSFQKAVDLSAGFLEQETMTKLTMLARRTVEPTDDQIVERIGNLDNSVKALEEKSVAERGRLEGIFKRKEELLRISSQFRRSHYDDAGSIFAPGSDLEELLGQLLRGAITGADYWARARRRQHWQDRPADPYRRRSQLPPFGDMFDFPSYPGSSGGGGGDDFETGGGF